MRHVNSVLLGFGIIGLISSCAHYDSTEWDTLRNAVLRSDVNGVRDALKHDFVYGFAGVEARYNDNPSEQLIREAVSRNGAGKCRSAEITKMLIKAKADFGGEEVRIATVSDCWEHVRVLMPFVNPSNLSNLALQWRESRNSDNITADSEKVAGIISKAMRDNCNNGSQELCGEADVFIKSWQKLKMAVAERHKEMLAEEKRREEANLLEEARKRQEIEDKKTAAKLKLEYDRRALSAAEKGGASHVMIGLFGSVARGYCRSQLDGGVVCDRGGLICSLPVFRAFVIASSRDPENYGSHMGTMFDDPGCDQGVAAEEFYIQTMKPLDEGFIERLPVRRGPNIQLSNRFGAKWQAAQWVEVGTRFDGSNFYRIGH